MAYKTNVPRRRTIEFQHYEGCGRRDPANCSACALTIGGRHGPNYAGWPLVYIEQHRRIPAKWKKALERQTRSENRAYADRLKAVIALHGCEFDDEQITSPRSGDLLPRPSPLD